MSYLNDPLLDLLTESRPTETETPVSDNIALENYVSEYKRLREALVRFDELFPPAILKEHPDLLHVDNIRHADVHALLLAVQALIGAVNDTFDKGDGAQVSVTVYVTGTFNADTGYLQDVEGDLASIDEMFDSEGNPLGEVAREHITKLLAMRTNKATF